jgi:hypothetical protein
MVATVVLPLKFHVLGRKAKAASIIHALGW